MEYKKCSVAGVMYDPEREMGSKLTHKDLVENLKQGTNSPDMIADFLTLLTVCHTVIPEEGEDGLVRYNAASPDEKALVEGAENYDYKFIVRKPESVTIKTCKGEALLRRMMRLGLLLENERKLDYVLGLTTAKIMERRLQTKVFKLGLAKSIHHARCLIRQRHIRA